MAWCGGCHWEGGMMMKILGMDWRMDLGKYWKKGGKGVKECRLTLTMFTLMYRLLNPKYACSILLIDSDFHLYGLRLFLRVCFCFFVLSPKEHFKRTLYTNSNLATTYCLLQGTPSIILWTQHTAIATKGCRLTRLTWFTGKTLTASGWQRDPWPMA